MLTRPTLEMGFDPQVWRQVGRQGNNSSDRAIFGRDRRFRRGRKYDSRSGLDWRPAHMAAPYSLDLRKRVVAAVAAGMSRKQAATHYQVSHSSAIRWTRRLAETGSPAALPMGGKKPFTLADEETWIRDRVDEKPDMTGRELLAELNQRGIEVGYYAVWHFLDHVGLSFKKSLHASEQDRADVARRRRRRD